MAEKISRDLYIVVPVTQADGRVVYVHGAPISREVFDAYFMVVSKTFAAIYLQGLGEYAGPRVASKILKQIAMDLGAWSGEAGVERGLMNEIRRLTNVLAPGPRGWETVPLHEAVARGFLDDEDLDEVENALVYFTVASRMHKRSEREVFLRGAASLWSASISSSDCSAYASSLETSTETASSGPRAASSVPS